MKLIDEKGKLFGKLNIIDALVLLVVILAVALVGVKVLQNHQAQLEQQRQEEEQTANQEEYWLTYTVKVEAVEGASAEAVKQFVDRGQNKIDQMLTAAGLQDGYIVDVEVTPHVTYVECEDGTVKRVESSGEDDRKDLLFTCVANVEDFEMSRISAQEIRVGIPHIIKTAHFEFRTDEVITVEWVKDLEKTGKVVDLETLYALREEFLAEEED